MDYTLGGITAEDEVRDRFARGESPAEIAAALDEAEDAVYEVLKAAGDIEE
jgi:hypothetical protein